MRSSNEEEDDDLFFDSLDNIRTSFDTDDSEVTERGSGSADLDLAFAKFEYEIWRNEPGSIRERREKFLSGMGFTAHGEPLSPTSSDKLRSLRLDGSKEIEEDDASWVGSLRLPETDRLTENSGAVLRMHSLDGARESLGERMEPSLNCRSSVSSMMSSRTSTSSWTTNGTLDPSDAGSQEDMLYSIRDLDSGKEFIVYELGQDGLMNTLKEVGSNRLMTVQEFEKSLGLSCFVQKLLRRDVSAHGAEYDGGQVVVKKKRKTWWKCLRSAAGIVKWQGGGRIWKTDNSVMVRRVPIGSKPVSEMEHRMRVQHRRKRYKEFTALYMGQEIQAHKGYIWTMKFSRDGQFLATAGEDGIVRVWHVKQSTKEEWGGIPKTDSCFKHFVEKSSSNVDIVKLDNCKGQRKTANSASIVIPEKFFQISEKPVDEFRGHTAGVLDLSWSKSNYLLSSSKDKTVRLWQVGCNKCLKVFQHNNYVTCIQFNPVDDRHFISGSIDGKVRIWGISECQVVDWADIREIVTAVCYRPDGQGCIVGSIAGNCRFYDISGNRLQLDAQVRIPGRKKSSGKRITGFQFLPADSQRVMVTSADSQVRIFDGVDVIHKYRGLRNSGSQISATFTSNGRYIVSVSEDSHVYVWNYNGFCVPASKQVKPIRSCERFFADAVSVAIPWSGIELEQRGSGNNALHRSFQQPAHLQTSFCLRDSDCFSIGGGFFGDGLSKCSATWPEEKLIPWSPLIEDGHHHNHHHHYHHHPGLSATWGLVIVTAGWDGVVRAFHNFGLPLRL